MRNGASDRLSHYGEGDEKLTFHQLMGLYRQQIHEEFRLSADDDELTRTLFLRSAQEMSEAHDAAVEIYDRHIREAAQEMQDSEDESLQGIGRALSTGDWSHVAI